MSTVKVELCDSCKEKLRKASALGGRNGSLADKKRAGKASAKARQKMATKLRFNGETLRITQWAERLHIPRRTIYKRLERNLPVEKVLCAKGVEHLPSV